MNYRSDVMQVEIFTNFLYPGMILKGKGYDEKGNIVVEKDIPLTKEQIDKIRIDGVKKITYSREKLKLKKDVSVSMVSDKNVEKAISIIDDIQGSIKQEGSRASLPVHEVDDIIKDFISDIKSNDSAFLNLLDLFHFDDYTYTHSVNVATISILLGYSLNLDEEKIRILGISGLLHDIGKTLIPESIVDKVEKLTDVEWKIIKNHSVYGYNIVHAEKIFGNNVENAILLHHENYMGGGYPLGVNNEKQTIFSQTLSVADVFDALTSKRPYKEPWSFSQAFSFFMENSGKKFNPKIVQTFLRDLAKKINEEPVYPVKSYVILNTGEVGYVIDHRLSPYTLRPIINIFYNQHMKEDELKKMIKIPLQIDLEGDYTRYIIKRLIDPALIKKFDNLTGINK